MPRGGALFFTFGGTRDGNPAGGGRQPDGEQVGANLDPGSRRPFTLPFHTGGFAALDLLKRGVKKFGAGFALVYTLPSPETLMIPRYTRPEMAAIWAPQTRFKIWFEIEAHAADAQAELGVIPKQAAKAVWTKAGDVVFDVARIDEIEREIKHDVIAFTTHLAEIVGPEARFVHQGMTSSDV